MDRPGADVDEAAADAADRVADEVLVALADATRRRLLDEIVKRGEATATALAADFPVSRQAIVKHLAVLDRAGLVVSHRRGREVRFAVRPDRLSATARWMAAVASRWDARLAAIARIAEATERAELLQT